MKVLVHFHLYYHDQLDWFMERLKNLLGTDFDLVVTYVEENLRSMRLLREFKEDLTFMKVDNWGYDIWPFIQVVRTVDLSKYGCVIKLHTKSELNRTIHLRGNVLKGHDWRDYLVEGLIGSQETVYENLSHFALDPEIGLLCPYKFYIRTRLIEDRIRLHYELKHLNLYTNERHFCAGTMFMINPKALEYLKSELIEPERFSSDMHSHSGGSAAHVYERVLSVAVVAQGFKVVKVGASQRKMAWRETWLTAEEYLKLFFSLERMGNSQAKYLTILGFRFKLDDGPGTELKFHRMKLPKVQKR